MGAVGALGGKEMEGWGGKTERANFLQNRDGMMEGGDGRRSDFRHLQKWVGGVWGVGSRM